MWGIRHSDRSPPGPAFASMPLGDAAAAHLSLRADPGSYDSRRISCPRKASEHDADHGQPDEGSDGAGVSLEIARQAAIAADPGQGSFNDPALRQDDKFVQFVALDDLDHPMAGVGSGSRGAWSLVAGIGEDALDEGEQAAGASIENQPGPVAVLNVGGMDDDVQQEAERIDQDMALAPGDLLARIKPLRVKRGAPF